MQAGFKKGNVDDMLEYSLWLMSGADGVPLDLDLAMKILNKVLEGPFPPAKRAVAASLASSISAYHLHRGNEGWKDFSLSHHMPNGINFCYESCGLGLYSNSCCILNQICLSLAELVKVLPEEADLPEKVDFLDEQYLEFLDQTGQQTVKSRICAACGRWARCSDRLKKCAGKCHNAQNRPTVIESVKRLIGQSIGIGASTRNLIPLI
ncbi:hypothetical protein NLJ89_g9706 [Agrocybe chaxingu]|uniref:Uncharacterized protein n=1 Tax=Agrocybe chaxingu TaxID=84603 RepID=A0A9W8JS72_9AGAR|nr:hypothetical protein NLJ89_g9706 [Agrocybe chaxingu]